MTSQPDLILLIKQRFQCKIREEIHEFWFAHDGERALSCLRAAPGLDIVLFDIN